MQKFNSYLEKEYELQDHKEKVTVKNKLQENDEQKLSFSWVTTDRDTSVFYLGRTLVDTHQNQRKIQSKATY